MSNQPNPNFTYLHEKIATQRVTLLQGGTRSGKTIEECEANAAFIVQACNSHEQMKSLLVKVRDMLDKWEDSDQESFNRYANIDTCIELMDMLQNVKQ